jgi:hypothetical protein
MTLPYATMKNLGTFGGVSLILSFAAAVMDVNGQQSVGTSYTLAVPRGFSSIANHLDHGGNTVAELLPSVPEGTLLYKFDEVQKGIHTVNQFQFGAWSRPKETLSPGEGAFLRNPGPDFSITFTGTKPSNTQFPRLTRGLNFISLPAPGETSLPTPAPGDFVYRLDVSRQQLRPSTFDDYDNNWIPCLNCAPLGPLGRIGESFFYNSKNAPVQLAGSNVISGGTIYFSNYLLDAGIAGVSEQNQNLGEVWRAVNARVTFTDGRGIGEGFTAQLYGGPSGTSVSNLVALTPSTTFQTGSAMAGYVKPIVITTPWPSASTDTTVIMRVFDGTSYDSSTIRGESTPITLKPGGAVLLPANLVGLQGFSLRAPIGGNPQIGIERMAGGLRLTYTGTLQISETVTGPFLDVIGAASPATIPFSGTARFYRLKP